MFLLDSTAAFWFMIAVTPICLWVIQTDLKEMKIRNKAVLSLIGIYGVVGLLTLPMEQYLWGYAQMAVVFVFGFILSMAKGFGTGDAKFLIAMSPFVNYFDAGKVLFLLGIFVLGAFVLHRIVRVIPAVPAALPNWESWTSNKFPVGLALASGFWAYLAMAALQ